MTAWRLLSDDGAGGAAGLALDEALMAGYRRDAPPKPPTLRLYSYRSHVALVGRYQHLDAEIDRAAASAEATEINRRPTGGGAIVMGSGQLGVALVTRAPVAERPKELLQRLSAGIITGLDSVGVSAGFRGKNDLQVGGRKIAGLGLYLDGRGALLFHASVLADLDVAHMLRVLRIPAAKLGGAGQAAVAARITTVTAETGQPYDAAQLRPLIAAGFGTALGVTLRADTPSGDELRDADALVAERYGTEEWLSEMRPQQDATATATVRTPAGLVRLYLASQGDLVKSVLFAGDFSVVPEALLKLESALKWARLDGGLLEVVRRAFADSDELGPPEAFAEALLEAGAQAAARPVAEPVRQGSCYFPEAQEAP